ncbi:MAG: UDP-N-acetylmuramoyl-tripeptide--D-alanyl-D-alanine ligase [Planctomycetes bacterium]|nr:UDP-N-acetylmuramoyl-tripeptide--D-alanyl-D-alanine ligase [Planctomycetota bacterium]
MSVFRVQEILDSTGSVLARGDARKSVVGVSTDTRTLQHKQLFIALSGENFDGNRFAVQAAQRGASVVMLRGAPGDPLPDLPGEVAIAWHPDPRRALGDLAAAHRAKLKTDVIGITGSCGKTTTKNILSELLKSVRNVVSSPASFNNDVGVPHTLLLADETTGALIVEMGTNGPGEIAQLARIARPTGAIITNIGPAHLQGLGSIEGVAREKCDLFAALPREAFAVLNLDSRHHELLRDSTVARVITISVDGEGELNATELHFDSGFTTFRLNGDEVAMPLLGKHNVSNLLAALAACRGIGLDLRDVLPAVARLTGGRQRMERHAIGDLVVIDDSYNANPDSARAAVRVLAGLHGHARRVFVLGDMLELGPTAPELHHKLGEEVAHAGIDLFVLVGELAECAASGALIAGMPKSRVLHFATVEDAEREFPSLLASGDVALIKGSRRMSLERLTRRLEELHPTRAA